MEFISFPAKHNKHSVFLHVENKPFGQMHNIFPMHHASDTQAVLRYKEKGSYKDETLPRDFWPDLSAEAASRICCSVCFIFISN